MLTALLTASSGLAANQNQLDAISNNIANLDTTGYKSMDVDFQDVFYDKIAKLGIPVTAQNTSNLLVGSGSKADNTVTNDSQGGLTQTNGEDDLAIQGNGYFRLKDANGNFYYTRDGSFKMDSNGNLVSSSGMILDVQYNNGFSSQNMKSPLSIDTNGNITSNGSVIGKINLYNFNSRSSMLSVGNNLLQTTETPKAATGIIKQGYLENSNVDLTDQLTNMMITQRAFQLNSESVQTANQMWQIANNLTNK